MSLPKWLLMDKISSLCETEHEEIFKIFQTHGVPYTQNKNGIFINLSKLSDNIIEQIESFVAYCELNKKNLDEYSNRVTPSLLNATSQPQEDISMFLTREEINNKTRLDLIESSSNIKNIVSILESNLDKINKRHIENFAKFENAQKKYNKRISEKKINYENISNDLFKENYIIN